MSTTEIKKRSDIFLSKILPKKRVNPATLTLFSIIFKFATIYALFKSFLYLAIIFILLEVIFDILDGFYARSQKTLSNLGGFIDHFGDYCLRPIYLIVIASNNIISFKIITLAIFVYLSSVLLESIILESKLKKLPLPSWGIPITLIPGILFNCISLIIFITIILNIITILIKFLSVLYLNKIKS